MTELMSHVNTSANLAEFVEDRVSTDEHNMAYVLGETNTGRLSIYQRLSLKV